MTKVHTIGIICEDDSDFNSIKVLIRRIVGVDNLNYKKQCGEGSSRIKYKTAKWAQQLNERGCQLVIVVHDLDRENYNKLEMLLTNQLNTSGAKYNYVCIPIEELEAWYLTDPDVLKKIFKLERQPKFKGKPESITSPKEKIKTQVKLCSNGRARYLNTTHNPRLAELININNVYISSKTFKNFHDYLLTLQYR